MGESNGTDEMEEIRIPIPSLSDIFERGTPLEYIPLLVLSLLLCVFIFIMLVRSINEHRKHITKHTMQGLCTLGIILTFPIFALMYCSGMMVPKAMAKVTFIAETYETVSLLFFLRLILTYMGGKKETVAKLKGLPVALNNPPICCCICLPHIKFSKKYFVVNEIFVVQLAVFQFVLGYIDLLIGLDESHSYPAALVEETYSHYFHGFILLSLLLAVYGLGGIYHSAEATLQHYSIFKKFVLYKAFVTLVKVEELAVTLAADKIADMVDLTAGAISTNLRIHLWCYALVMIETAAVFPFLLKAYGTEDYPTPDHPLQLIEEEVPMVEMKKPVETRLNRGTSTPNAEVDTSAPNGEVDTSTPNAEVDTSALLENGAE